MAEEEMSTEADIMLSRTVDYEVELCIRDSISSGARWKVWTNVGDAVSYRTANVIFNDVALALRLEP